MAGLFSRVKVWNTGETVNAVDLNTEFNNILANVDAIHSEGVSQNLSQMQSTESPGGVGSENLTQPISVAQEIKRIRYAINRIIGGAFWYSSPDTSLDALNQTVTESLNLPNNRIISGRVDSSNQPDFIRAGTTNVKLLCSATPFVVVIDGVEYTFSSDITLTGLSSGYTSQHTAISTDTWSGGELGRTVGEIISLYLYGTDRSFLTLGTVGSQISSRAGQLAVMKIVNSGVTDYFLCRISSSTQIASLFRGFFKDTAGVATSIATLTGGETVTLLKMTYLFLNTSGVLIPIYSEPFYQPTTPASFSTGDYWFDTSIQMWKTYNGAAWIQANATLVGICAQDSTGCVISRSSDFFREFSNTNEISLDAPPATGSIYRSKRFGGRISVYGNEFTRINEWEWDLATDMDSGLTAAAGFWYLYITDTGDTVISNKHPNDRFGSLSGFYHPAKPWRCVGMATAASASTWDTTQPYFSLRSISLESIPDESVSMNHLQPRANIAGAYSNVMALGGFAVSGPVDALGATDQTTTSATPVNVNNLSVTLEVTGKRPVRVSFDYSVYSSIVGATKTGFRLNGTPANDVATGTVFILRNGSIIARHSFTHFSVTNLNNWTPAGAFAFIDTPPKGTHVYTVQMQVDTTNTTIAAGAQNQLSAYEIF